MESNPPTPNMRGYMILDLLDTAPDAWNGRGVIIDHPGGRDEVRILIAGKDTQLAPGNGVISEVPIPQGNPFGLEGTFNLEFSLDKNFDPTIRGMKLLGFGHKRGAGATGGNRDNVGKEDFTYRLMPMYPNGQLDDDGRNKAGYFLLSHYAYFPYDPNRNINTGMPPKDGKYGWEYKMTEARIVPGRRYTVGIYVKLNTIRSDGNPVPNFDGVLAVYFDGKRIDYRTSVVYRLVNLPLDTLLWHVFTGGGGEDWSPRKDAMVNLHKWTLQPGNPYETSPPDPVEPPVQPTMPTRITVPAGKQLIMDIVDAA